MSVVFFLIVKSYKWLAVSIVGFLLNLFIVLPFLYPGATNTIDPKPELNYTALTLNEAESIRVDPKAPESLTIMMSNVLTSNTNKDSLLNLVMTVEPDLLVLVEIDDKWIQSLKTLYSLYPHRKLLPKSDNFGIGIMSKFPLKNIQILHFVSPRIPSIVADVELSNNHVHLVATHALPPVSTNWFNKRNLQFKKIAKHMISAKGHKLVIGDFNITRFSPHYEQFITDSKLKNVGHLYGIQPTWPTFSPIFKIQLDYAFVDTKTKIEHFEVFPSIGSDHLPIFCELLVGFQVKIFSQVK